MAPYTLHITLYDLAFFGAIITGLNTAVFLWFTKRINRAANRLLALVLVTVVLRITWVLCIDVGLSAYYPHWNRLPLNFSLALGPLLYFYVLKITKPYYKFEWKDLLHFSPLALEQGLLILAISESNKMGTPTYHTHVFQRLNPIIQLLAFVSVIVYLYLSHQQIEGFYQTLKFTGGDRYRHHLRWLQRLLIAFGGLWLLWIPFAAIGNFGNHDESAMHIYYPLYLILTAMITWIGAMAFLRPDGERPLDASPASKLSASTELRQKGVWLKRAMEANRYFEDPDLSLPSLAEKLNMPVHDLSRIINIALKKNFNDLINDYRVREVIRKMQNPAYNHLTLLGIAFESGFNSRTTFHRIFKQTTGKSPAEYKTEQKKEIPSYNLEHFSRIAPVISNQQTAPKWFDDKLNRNYMFKNYLKSAWRHIMRHKTYSAINVMGLALGICGCLVIYLVASFEFSFDTFHPDKDRIYCVDISSTGGAATTSLAHWNSVPGTMADMMRGNMSGLETVAAFHPYTPKVTIKAGNEVAKTFDKTEAVIAQPEYFDILPYTWLSGNKNTALADPKTVVLTQSRAQTYFGNLRPDQMIGRTITYEDSLTVTVTGILQDWNKNSDFNFSDFISFSTIKNSVLKRRISLDNQHVIDGSSQMLLKLAASVSPSQIDAQFPAFVKKYVYPDLPGTHAQLQPFTGIHFHKEYGGKGGKADLRVLYILSAVAIFILIIAAVNFINLSTAQSIQRTKDIGILKVLGSGRGGILLQFLIETFTLALLAVAIAVIAIQPLLNLFAAYIPQGVKFSFTDYTTWLFLAGIAIFTTLFAGFYPARLLSAFKPVASLKGDVSDKRDTKGYLRKSLIVFQFTISLIFIIGTLVVDRQINYMQNVDLGVNTSNIITLKSLFGDQTGKIKVLVENIKRLPGIEQVITDIMPPMNNGHMIDNIQLQGSKKPNLESYTYSGNEDFVPFYQMKIVAGRNLLHTDSATEYLINETAAKAMGFTKPQQAIGKRLVTTAGDKAYPIVGVVADFCQATLYDQIIPCTIANNPDLEKAISLKLTPAEYKKGDIPLLVSNIEKEWKKLYPKQAFDFAFLGDSVAKLYEKEQQTAWLMRTATIITIFISCMGLFGLAMFTTERRTKEISIRKMMGASVANILTMLNKEVVVLITIALLISSPIAWIFISKWLQNFAYHTSLSFWVFILAGLGAMLIALVTISIRTIRSARANPVKGLRNE